MTVRVEFMDNFQGWQGFSADVTSQNQPTLYTSPWIHDDWDTRFDGITEDWTQLTDANGLKIDTGNRRFKLAPSLSSVNGLSYFHNYQVTVDGETIPNQGKNQLGIGMKVDFTQCYSKGLGGLGVYFDFSFQEVYTDLPTDSQAARGRLGGVRVHMAHYPNGLSWFPMVTKTGDFAEDIDIAAPTAGGGASTVIRAVVVRNDDVWAIENNELQDWIRARRMDWVDGTQSGVDIDILPASQNGARAISATTDGTNFYVLVQRNLNAAPNDVYAVWEYTAAWTFVGETTINTPPAYAGNDHVGLAFLRGVLYTVINVVGLNDRLLAVVAGTESELENTATFSVQDIEERRYQTDDTFWVLKNDLAGSRLTTYWHADTSNPLQETFTASENHWFYRFDESTVLGIHDDGCFVWGANGGTATQLNAVRYNKAGIPLLANVPNILNGGTFERSYDIDTTTRFEAVVGTGSLMDIYVDGVDIAFTRRAGVDNEPATDAPIDADTGMYNVRLCDVHKSQRDNDMGYVSEVYVKSADTGDDIDMLANWNVRTVRPTSSDGDFFPINNSASTVVKRDKAEAIGLDYIAVENEGDSQVVSFALGTNITGTIDAIQTNIAWNRDDLDSSGTSYGYDHDVTLAFGVTTANETNTQFVEPDTAFDWAGFQDNGVGFSNYDSQAHSTRVFETNPTTGVAWTEGELTSIRIYMTTYNPYPYIPFPY